MEQAMPQEGNPIQDAMQGMMKSVEADAHAADAIEQMGQKEAADLLRKSAQLKQQALEMLTQGGNDMQGADTAGTNAAPMNMATRG